MTPHNLADEHDLEIAQRDDEIVRLRAENEELTKRLNRALAAERDEKEKRITLERIVSQHFRERPPQ